MEALRADNRGDGATVAACVGEPGARLPDDFRLLVRNRDGLRLPAALSARLGPLAAPLSASGRLDNVVHDRARLRRRAARDFLYK